MTSTTIRITLPYEPSSDLTGSLYDDVEAIWGADVGIDLSADGTERGLGDIDPTVLVIATYVGGTMLNLATEEALKAVATRLGRLLTRLRRGDRDEPEGTYEVRIEGIGPTRAVFHFDAAAEHDRDRAVAEMTRLGASTFPPGTHLTWDAAIGCWRRSA
jgi:hypothetical protein